ncbi:MAG: rhomboid family intramembrane serine protease [Anaerolineales bacterium]
MLPVKDLQANRYHRYAGRVTMLLIVVNTLILGWELYLAYSADVDGIQTFFTRFGFVPVRVFAGERGVGISIISHLFLHGGFMHLLGNMLALWVFGRRVEDACGAWRYLFFYLFAGLMAAMVSAFILRNEDIPSIGASGAIFGVMGAYLLLFPEGKIQTLVLLPFLGIPVFLRIRAVWVVLYFLGLQAIPAIDIYLHGAVYSIGYWAHLGGFIAAIFVFFFLRPTAYRRYWSKLPV